MNWKDFQKRARAPRADELDELTRMIVAARGFKGKHIAPELVRRVLAEPLPPRLPPKTHAFDAIAAKRALIFFKEAVDPALDDETLVARWAEANQALVDLNAYEWGSKARRAKLAAIVATPWQLHALQAAVVGISPPDHPGLDVMAVLALDGSEASADALMPHVHHAMTSGEGLEQLERLEKVAADTPAMRAMLANAKGLLAQRSKESPIIALMTTIGVEVDACAYTLWMGSRAERNQWPIAQVNFSVDSRAQPYIQLSIDGPSGTTSWNDRGIHRDALGFGRPELTALPEYFARAAKALQVEWSWDEANIISSLRGKKREAVLRWLRSRSG